VLSLCHTPATATTTADMDLFTFYPPSRVLICKPCGYAVPPTTLSSHIRCHHLDDARHAATNPSGRSRNSANLLATYLCQQYQLLDPATTKIPTPPVSPGHLAWSRGLCWMWEHRADKKEAEGCCIERATASDYIHNQMSKQVTNTVT